MTKNNAVGSRVLQGVFFALLLAVFGLAGCGSGGGSTTTTNTSPTTLPAPGGIVLSLVPARTSGVAPLAVFFDASGTTDTGVTTRPFHDLEYTWSFGDPSSGTWANGAQPGVSSKNSATGPVAAHVFETPGTYTVTLTAFDGTNTATTNTTITVQDSNTVFAGTNTVCVGVNIAPTAGEGGCPANAVTVAEENFATAVNAHALAGKRVLFRRGDTFVAPTTGSLTRTGPGILGAFGTGSAPKVQATGNTTVLNLSSYGTPDIKDWRIMDLEFDGLGGPGSIGIDTQGGINQVLVLNMNIHDVGNGILFNDSIVTWWYFHGNPAHAMFDDMAIIGSTITPVINSTTGWRLFVSAKRLSIQGNSLGNMINNVSMGSHVVRIPYMEKGVLSNNTIARAGVTQGAIKLHSQAWCSNTSAPGTCVTPDNNAPMPPGYGPLTNTHPIGVFAATSGYSEQIVISDNKIIGANNPWTTSLGPQDANNDERVRDLIVERIWFTAGSGTQLHIHLDSSDTTVRNNIFNLTGGPYHQGISVTRWGGTSQVSPNNIRIINNTFYSGATGDFTGVGIDSVSTNVSVINNLCSAPLATTDIFLIDGTGASGFFQSNNVLNNTPSALFTNATPSVPADFSLKALPNPARDTGLSTVPVWSDFFRTSRPQSGVIDLGAVEGH